MNRPERSRAETYISPSPTPFFKSQEQRYETFQKQDDILKLSFSVTAKTMLQVSIETGIFRANICRFISKQRKQGRIQLVKYGLCPVSKYKAGFYIMKGSCHV